MALYFSAAKIPALADYTFKQRSRILSIALSLISVPDKLFLNVVKLALLAPLFILIARVEGWLILLPLVALVTFYPLITNPLMLFFAQKELDNAIKKFTAEEKAALDDDEEEVNDLDHKDK
ncbi:DUF6170 family protein [Algibacillus agarilyticus]|uniref:DUF6170 family protein n=1 Tax=Algibacillus agarilyticus TaxID=2234133 RepID=UPI000DD0BD9C|nr:DUF6170 family protein [Algibacillus agarilyticus]